MSGVCTAGWPAVLSGKNCNIGYYKLFNQIFFIPAMLIGTIDQKPTGFTFLHFSSNQDEIWFGDEAIQDCFWLRFMETREISAVLQTVSKNIKVGMHSDFSEWVNVDMHSDISEWIWFKLGMMIDTTFWYWSARKPKLLCQLSHKVLNQFEWIWYTIETCWCDEPLTHFILSI